MRICQPEELDWEQVTLLCRQGRWLGVAGRALVAGILVGAPVFWKISGAPWLVWGMCGLLALGLTPTLLRGIYALFLPANWVLAVTPRQVWINLRYFENHALPPGATVVQLELTEIASVARQADRFTTPASGSRGFRSVQRQSDSLQIELTHRATEALADALRSEQSRRTPPRRWFGGLVKTSSRLKQSTLMLASPGVLQVLWRDGKGNHVVPALDRVLEKLAPQVHVHEPQQRDFKNWDALDKDEVDQLARQLAAQGDVIAAAKLLVRRQRLSLEQAKRKIEQWSTSAQSNPSAN